MKSAAPVPYADIEAGIVLGDYSPRMGIKISLLNKNEKIIVGGALNLTLKEEESIKGISGTILYALYERERWEFTGGIETGLELSSSELSMLAGICSSLSYLIRQNTFFRTSLGINRGIDLNVYLLSGVLIGL
ncbi:MAG: hypothetical protein JXA66_08720 [Oligoflexia bacterium]|nr:hypothetical protein [Oligoflexia bacterium]